MRDLNELLLGGDHDLREVIEPALASWKYQPARELWLERLRLPDAPSDELVLAMRGLAALREPEAASRLTELVDSSEVSWPVRLEAARALVDAATPLARPALERAAARDPDPRVRAAAQGAVALECPCWDRR